MLRHSFFLLLELLVCLVLYYPNMAFQLKTESFEGPLELLLSLIEDKKLHVSEISLAQVTEEYLHYLNAFDEVSDDEKRHMMVLSDRSQFVAVAATLILIKARSLLPAMELSDEETESIDDLTERLRLYEIVVRYGEILRNHMTVQPVMYRGNPPKTPRVPKFLPHESVNIQTLTGLLSELFVALPVTEKLQEKSVKKTMTLEEVMRRVEQAIKSGATFSLRDATDRYNRATNPEERREAKVYAVLSFLAVLEMVKKAQIMVEQNEAFNDIIATPYRESSL